MSSVQHVRYKRAVLGSQAETQDVMMRRDPQNPSEERWNHVKIQQKPAKDLEVKKRKHSNEKTKQKKKLL